MNTTIENTVEELQLDKSKWKLTKFGDVAKQQKGKVDRDNTELTRYIKGEHMGSEDLHIRSWGDLTDEYLGPAFIRKFEKGDILYGSRRTYLRKVAIADFDGITSNTTFVIKANEAKIDKRLLPFIMMSEGFTENSIKNSKGSVNPYINWKDIAKYEFLLPPKDQQAKLAELLWAMDEVVERENKLFETVKVAEEVKLKDIFLRKEEQFTIKSKLGPIDPNWKCVKLEELLNDGSITSHLDGNHGSYYPKNEEFVQKGVPYISANCIEDDNISLVNAKYLTEARANTISKGIAEDGDILLAHNATVGPVCMLRTKLDRMILSTSLTYYRVDRNKINPTFLFYYMRSKLFQSQLERVMSQSTRNQVPITTQRQLYFIIPPIDIQKELIKKISIISGTGKMVETKIENSKALQKSLINQVF